MRVHKWRAPSASALVPYLYVLPALALTIVWVYWPVVGTIQLSFLEWNLLPSRAPVWVGAANYEQLLHQPELAQALLNTGLYIVGLLPFAIVLPLGVALLLGRVHGAPGAAHRAVIFLPVLMAPIVVAVIWRWIMSPNGILNDALQSGLHRAPVNMLTSPALGHTDSLGGDFLAILHCFCCSSAPGSCHFKSRCCPTMSSCRDWAGSTPCRRSSSRISAQPSASCCSDNS